MTAIDRPSGPLRLRATDGEDLQIVSAALQDAIVPIADMAYLPEERQFAMVVNRFKWEALPDGQPQAGNGDGGQQAAYQRTNCGVTIGTVKGVQRRGVDPRQRDGFLSLLAMELDGPAVRLIFAGGGEVKLILDESGPRRLDCRLYDLGQPWPTQWRPAHAFEEQGERT